MVALFQRHLIKLLVDRQSGLIQGRTGERLVLELRLELLLSRLDPFSIRLPGLEAGIDIPGQQQLTGGGVGGQHLAGFQSPFYLHIRGVVVVHSDLGRERDVAVIGDHVTRRAQPIAIHDAGSIAAVGEHDAGGTVPGLHVHAVILVEGLQVRVHGVDVLPGGWDQQSHGAENVHAARQQHFEHVVESAGIGTTGGYQRAHVFHVRDQRGFEFDAARH